ncbi:hypothetical protein PMAYCL1PPCAC_09325, partial [Pristionchus mayeri]
YFFHIFFSFKYWGSHRTYVANGYGDIVLAMVDGDPKKSITRYAIIDRIFILGTNEIYHRILDRILDHWLWSVRFLRAEAQRNCVHLHLQDGERTSSAMCRCTSGGHEPIGDRRC